jgi:hypothetical protein
MEYIIDKKEELYSPEDDDDFKIFHGLSLRLTDRHILGDAKDAQEG